MTIAVLFIFCSRWLNYFASWIPRKISSSGLGWSKCDSFERGATMAYWSEVSLMAVPHWLVESIGCDYNKPKGQLRKAAENYPSTISPHHVNDRSQQTFDIIPHHQWPTFPHRKMQKINKIIGSEVWHDSVRWTDWLQACESYHGRVRVNYTIAQRGGREI